MVRKIEVMYTAIPYRVEQGATPPNSEIICGQNVSTKVVCGILLFFEKKAMLKI